MDAVLPSSVIPLQTEEPHRVALQDAVPIYGRQPELFDDRAGISMSLALKLSVPTTMRSDPTRFEEEAQPLRVIRQIVVMESPHTS